MLSAHNKKRALFLSVLLSLALALSFTYSTHTSKIAGDVRKTAYIVQGMAIDAMVETVTEAGGEISHRLPIINAIGAVLTHAQYLALTQSTDLTFSENHTVKSHSKGHTLPEYATDTFVVQQTGASKLHQYGVTGQGVTVAIIDSGLADTHEPGAYLRLNTRGDNRVRVKYDLHARKRTDNEDDDLNGHGSHIAGIIASSTRDASGNYNGMAPDVNLISIKAFDEDGQGNYLDIIEAIEWVVKNRRKHRIRVLNMSFGAEVRTHYWEDPLNQAVMKAWDKGIVVVTSAGNAGPADMTITAPGNVPYVISVGAMTDNYTPYSYRDDRMTTFSAKGPTIEGFVKPDLVTFGGHVLGKIKTSHNDAIMKRFKATGIGAGTESDYFEISGTSQAAAVVTGTVALMLQLEPNLRPDTVKCRLMATATANPKYSPFEQGAGNMQAWEAAMSYANDCANVGLDIDDDLDGEEHFIGPALINESGQFGVAIGDGKVLSEGIGWEDVGTLIENGIWNEGFGWDGVSDLEGIGWEDVTHLQGIGWEDVAGLQGIGWEDVRLQGIGWEDVHAQNQSQQDNE